MSAAYNGRFDMVQLLLESGADPDQGNPGFPTALGTAVAFGHSEIEGLLRAHGATRMVGAQGPGVEEVLEHAEAVTLPVAPRGHHREALLKTLGTRLGRPEQVVEVPSTDAIALSLHVVPPGRLRRRWWTIVTLGMSDRETTGQHAPDPRRTELVLRLPRDWDMAQALDPKGDPSCRWPIDQLVHLAHLPHRYETSLVEGDTVPHGEPFDRSTELSGWLFVPAASPVGETQVVRPAKGVAVHLLGLVAVHESEMRLELEQGMVPMMRALGWNELSPVLDPSRKAAR